MNNYNKTLSFLSCGVKLDKLLGLAFNITSKTCLSPTHTFACMAYFMRTFGLTYFQEICLPMLVGLCDEGCLQ